MGRPHTNPASNPAREPHERLIAQGLAHRQPAGLSNEGLTTLVDLLTITALQGAGSPNPHARITAATAAATLSALTNLTTDLAGEPTNRGPILEHLRNAIKTTRTT